MHTRLYLFAVILLSNYMVATAQDTANALPANVVARQGGVDVTIQDIDAQAAMIPEKDRAGFFDSPKRIESVVTSLLLKKQLAAAARAEKLDKDPAVQRQIQLAIDDTLAGAQLNHYRSTLKLPDFEVLAKEYYAAHQDEFLDKGDIVVEHVLISNKERTEAEASAKIGEIEAMAKAHPDQFESLVEKYSEDPSKERNHGRIEKAGSGKMVRPFAAAANALQTPGEISPIVKTEYGFHVLKLVERKPDTQKSFADVHNELISKMRANFIDTQMNQYSGDFRGNPLQASPDLVASLRTRYMPAGAKSPEEAQSDANDATPAQKPAETSSDVKH
jgi:parvulin-like peptidyl-prolyl isomerase